tara:strand:- start:129 stop:740 length:612 start_codon:yes stop_codon:yes gene_type:complete
MIDPAIVLLWLQNHPEWVVYSIFVAAFIESFAIIGLIVPGVVLLALISGLAGTLNLPIYYVLLLAYLGACLADILSFIIGRYFKERLDKAWPFLNHPKWLNEGREFIDLYGVTGIFIGRFIGPVRALLPLMAGSLGMQVKKFIIVDLISGIFWACIYLLPGYFAGKAVTNETNVVAMILSAIAAVVAVYLASRYRMLKKKSRP